MKRMRFVVVGRVQGVGFRMAARSAALPLGLVGFVRNRADGAVEGEVQGEDEPLSSFRDWLRRGPLLARVDRVDWDPIPAKGGEDAFAVMR